MTVPAGPTASRSGGSARPVPQPTSMTTPPRLMPASATAAQYAGRSSPNLASQVAARQAKNARVSVRYHGPRAGERRGHPPDHRPVDVVQVDNDVGALLALAAATFVRSFPAWYSRFAVLLFAPVLCGTPGNACRPARSARRPPRPRPRPHPASPGRSPGAAARPASPRAGRRRASPVRPGRPSARTGTGRAGARSGCQASPPTGACCCQRSPAPGAAPCWNLGGGCSSGGHDPIMQTPLAVRKENWPNLSR